MRMLYITTTFPVLSESFLQREVRAMIALGVDLHIVSLHGGEEEFEGLPVRRFEKWELLSLVYLLPFHLLVGRRQLRPIIDAMFSRRPRYVLNFWENLLGFGASIALLGESKSIRPDVVHCVWGSAPASFGWLSSCLIGRPFTMGAHAYDVFEHGGDWLLKEKVRNAQLVHCSTRSAADQVRSYGIEGNIRIIYRGLNRLPKFAPLRASRSQLRIVCIARLVEKKGFPWQLKIYRALKEAGVAFAARIVGEGPLREEIEAGIELEGLGDSVALLGQLSQAEALQELAYADVLFHTGVVASSGDRDGLPNVIPEAMASGTIVVASPVSGVVEAIESEVTGLIRSPEDTMGWVEACRSIREDNEFVKSLRKQARVWVERHFVAAKNTACLIELIGDETGVR